ncbi:MAG: serine hydrolase [Cyanobacteriota bacterium]|nr:serine hydrolase [Cyanobacteriota bacterium]
MSIFTNKQKGRSLLTILLTLVATLGSIASILFLWLLFSVELSIEKELPAAYAVKTAENYESEAAKSGFLEEIAIKSKLSGSAKITLCNLQHQCRHLHGNVAPLSAASLIKLPIAVAVFNKITAEQIDLDAEIYLEEENMTEEDFSALEGGNNYPLRQLLAETIINSSNSAPNQLIDYLTRDYINQVLEERGYQQTRVNSKFIGESTVPVNLGELKNSLNTRELTGMMVQIYNLEHPGDDLLIKILGLQHDRELGYAALQGTKARWLGEKTGQTSSVLGTTLAMRVAGQIYILTVIDDGEYTEEAIRSSIAKIADYLDRNGGL